MFEETDGLGMVIFVVVVRVDFGAESRWCDPIRDESESFSS
jgi:hypothetical protein